jgi:competence protein ComEC
LLAAALAFCVGDASSHSAAAWRPAIILLVCALTLAALALYAVRAQARIALLPALALWATVGFWSAEVQPAPSPQADLVHYADGLQRMVHAHIVRVRELPPQVRDEVAEDGVRPLFTIDLAVDEVEEVTPDISRMVSMNGGIRVTLTGDSASPTFRCGDAVETTLRLRTPERYRDPGAWQYADYLAAQGIGATATLPAYCRPRTLTAKARCDADSSRRSDGRLTG